MVDDWRFRQSGWTVGAKLLALVAVLSLAAAACAGGDESTAANEGIAETDASDSTDGTSGADEASDEDATDDDGDGDDDDPAADDDAAGDDAAGDDAADDNAADDGADDSADDGAQQGGELPNACPADGCRVEITGAEPGPGGEIELTFDANYTPDFEQNHIHVFWDSQEPGSVSSDYAAQGYEVQGDWHPTDEYPKYVTQSDASASSVSREGSTMVCVTAADTDHAVINATLYDCMDVADLLSS